MEWVLIALRLIPVIIALIQIAEKLFDDVPDSGEQKKQYVMIGIKALVQAAGIAGLEDNKIWKKIEEASNLLIDAMCLFLFPKDEIK